MQDKAMEKFNFCIREWNSRMSDLMREWGKKNKDQVKKYNDTYWERKANILEKEDE